MGSQTATFRIAIVPITLLLTASCGRPMQCDYFDFDFQKPLGYDQLIFRSSDIVVGTVVSVKITREGVPARKLPALLLDETRVEIHVENILLGDAKQPRLAFKFLASPDETRADIVVHPFTGLGRA